LPSLTFVISKAPEASVVVPFTILFASAMAREMVAYSTGLPDKESIT
jgi:hypothetical protein